MGDGQVVVGAQKVGATYGKMRLWRMAANYVASSGPWDYTTSGSAVKVAADPTGCYAFAATTWQTKGLQVIKVQSEAMTQLSSYVVSSSTLGTPTGLWHDPTSDRVYLVSTKGFTILGPGTSSPSCP